MINNCKYIANFASDDTVVMSNISLFMILCIYIMFQYYIYLVVNILINMVYYHCLHVHRHRGYDII